MNVSVSGAGPVCSWNEGLNTQSLRNTTRGSSPDFSLTNVNSWKSKPVVLQKQMDENSRVPAISVKDFKSWRQNLEQSELFLVGTGVPGGQFSTRTSTLSGTKRTIGVLEHHGIWMSKKTTRMARTPWTMSRL